MAVWPLKTKIYKNITRDGDMGCNGVCSQAVPVEIKVMILRRVKVEARVKRPSWQQFIKY